MAGVLTETDLAYLAGLIDGEGNFNVVFQNEGKGLDMRLRISNTDKRMIDWLLEHFGGVVATEQRKAPRKKVWTWRLSGVETALLLPSVIPYLVTKRDQAEIFLQIAQLRIPKGGSRYRIIPPEILEKRRELVSQLHEARVV